MRLGSHRQGSQSQPDSQVVIVIISATCCAPGMEPFDEQARQIIGQAISETGVKARVGVMSAVKAFFGGAPKGVMAKVISMAQSGQMPVPVILVNGKVISYGVPQLEGMKAALLEVQAPNNTKEE